jgi:hypothetical protein
MWITSLNSHLSEIYPDTRYGFFSMRTKRKPHRPNAGGDKRKEELTKRLCSLVYNSQDSCKKVPSEKSSHDYAQSMGIRREKREREGQGIKREKNSWQPAAGSGQKAEGRI